MSTRSQNIHQERKKTKFTALVKINKTSQTKCSQAKLIYVCVLDSLE